MERIILEVDDKIAKAWNKAGKKKRMSLNNLINIKLGKELFKSNKKEFQSFLDELRLEMKKSGLNQQQLDKLLSEND